MSQRKYRQKYHNFEEEEKKQKEEEEYVVVSFGKNDKVQTGHDHHVTNYVITNKNIYKPQIVKFLFDKVTNPIYITAGFDDSGFIDDSGNVILCGDNTNNQISNYKNFPYLGPHCLSLSNKIKQIALTSNSSLFLDKRGRVWSVGGANNGDLLLMEFAFSNNYNNKYNEYINYICCGYQHCGAISNYHKLYVWGNNKYSQLGFSSKNNYISYPKCIELQNGIMKCVMGRWHTLVLTDNGYIFSSGWGRFGALGLNDTYNRHKFEQITVKQNNVYLYVSDIKCGAVHSCCVVEDDTNNKKIYVWGRGKYGRLGLGNEENVLKPKLLNIRFEKYMDSVDKIELGGDHGIVISTYGSIYIWGKTLEGQLGFKTNSNILQPRKLVLDKYIVNKYRPINCTLGDCHSMLLMKKRKITSQVRDYYNR